MNADRITAIINEFLQPFDLTAQLDTDFCYYWQYDVVGYALVVTEKFDRLWTYYLHNHYPEVTAPLFIWSILHEVGHAETDDMISPEGHMKIDIYKKRLNPKREGHIYKYFHCADEVLATDWAYKYIISHPEEVKALWDRLQPAILEFYEQENITK